MKKVISIMSGKGGTGKTTIAFNLALAYAFNGKKVLLVDGDFSFPNLHLLLNTNTPSLLNAVEKKDKSEIKRSIIHTEKISFLGDSERADEPSEDSVLFLINTIKDEKYDIIIFDTSSGIGKTHKALASLSDIILLVTNAEPASLSDGIALVSQTDNAKRYSIILNKAPDKEKTLEIGRDFCAVLKSRFSKEFCLAGIITFNINIMNSVIRQRAFYTNSQTEEEITLEEISKRILNNESLTS